MAAIQFPLSPYLNQTFTVGYKTWIWNGYAWDLQIANTSSVTILAQSAFDKANSASSNTIYTQGVDSTQNTNITVATNLAQGAYNKANSVANTVSGTTNRITVSQPTGDVVIDLAPITGLTAGTYTYPYLQVDSYGRVTSINNQSPVISFNGQTGAITLSSSNVTSALGYTPVSYSDLTANTLYISGIDETQNTWISSNSIYTQAAFNKANGAVQLGWTTITANGVSVTPASNTDTLVITSTPSNGINILTSSNPDTIDFGLRPSGVIAGSYISSNITVDSFGRITSATNGSRVVTIADGTSITMDSSTTDIAVQTNTQTAGTLTINYPLGTPSDGQKLMLKIKSTNIQTFSWNVSIIGSTDLPLPTSSSGSSKTDYMGFIYNSSDSKWHLLAKIFGF